MFDNQAINIIEDAEGELRVSSLIIAQQTERDHEPVLRLIRDNLSDFEAFGRVSFENGPFVTAGGMQTKTYALLSEQQATLLITFMRNTDVVRAFKVALIKEFYRMRQALAAPSRLDPTTPDGMRLVLQAATTALAELEVAKPKADAWDELASAEGDYEVADAAKMLARAGVEVGRTRLFKYLAGIRWIYRGTHGKWCAYQSAVDSGYLVERPQWHFHPKTGDKVLDPPQIRVTARGLERLRSRMKANLAAVEGVAS